MNYLNNTPRKTAAILTLAIYLLSTAIPPAAAQDLLNLPEPGTLVALSESYTPPLLRGIMIDPDNPFHFDFIIDTGNLELDPDQIEAETRKVIKYFLASLTVPEDELWVNLSPYEHDRMIPEKFGRTEMGRDLLAQDYMLKQVTASLTYPENELGEKFWSTVYAKAYKQFGTTQIPVDTFNKVWIMPDSAVVYENQDTAYVQESRLKVMLEEDYLALKHHEKNSGRDAAVSSSLSSRIVREIMLPEIEREVNEGKTFAQLRQIYNALVLAAWFKENLKESVIAKIYVDQNKVSGVDVDDPAVKEKIYQRYLAALKKGVFDYIREDYDPDLDEMIPRKYFSGGAEFGRHVHRATTKKPLNKGSSSIIRRGAKGLIILVTALLSGTNTAEADQLIKTDPNQLPRLLDPNRAEMFLSPSQPETRSFITAKPLTEEELANIDQTAKDRVEKHLEAFRGNAFSLQDSVLVTGLAAVPYVIEAIFNENEPQRLRAEAASLLYNLYARSVKKPRFALPGQPLPEFKPDPRIKTVILPAARRILLEINNSDIGKHAANILEDQNAQPHKPEHGDLYIAYLVATGMWGRLAEAGEPALDRMILALEDSTQSMRDLYGALGDAAGSLSDQGPVQQKVIPALKSKLPLQNTFVDQYAVMALEIIAVSPNCSPAERAGIVDLLTGRMAEDEPGFASERILTTLSKIAVVMDPSDPVKDGIAARLLESKEYHYEELTEVASSYPEGHEMRNRIIDRFRDGFMERENWVSDQSVAALKKIGWQPQSKEDKLYFSFAAKDWDALRSMGTESVDFILGFFTGKHYTSRQAPLMRTLAGIVEDASDPSELAPEIIPIVLLELMHGDVPHIRLAASDALFSITRALPDDSPLIRETVDKVHEFINEPLIGKSKAHAIRCLYKLAVVLRDMDFILENVLPVALESLRDKDTFIVDAGAEVVGKISDLLLDDHEGIMEYQILPDVIRLYEENRGPAMQAISSIGRNLSDEHPFHGLMLNLSYRTAELEEGLLDINGLISVYQNPWFRGATDELHEVNQFSMARAIVSFLGRYGLPVNQEKISVLTQYVSAARDQYAQQVLLDKDHSVIIAVNDDDHAFYSKYVTDFFQQFLGPWNKPVYQEKVHGPYIGVSDNRKDSVRQDIRDSRGKTLVYLHGHGGPNHFWLHGGYEGEEKSNNLEHDDGISYKELAEDLIERAKGNNGVLSDLKIFIDSCHSGGFADNVYDALKSAFKKGIVKDLPLLVAATNRGTLAWSTSENGKRHKTEMLRGLEKASAGSDVLTGEAVFQAETYPHVAGMEDMEIFITLSTEDHLAILDALGAKSGSGGILSFLSLGKTNRPTTEQFLHKTLPVLGGLIGKQGSSKIITDTASETKKIEFYDRQNTLLGTRDLMRMDNSQARLAAAMEALKTPDNPQNTHILDAFLSLLEKAPPQFYTYSNPVTDLFGKAEPTENAIALTDELAGNHIAIYHELGEFYVRKEEIELSFDGRRTLTIIIDGQTFTFELSGRALAIALKGKQVADDGRVSYNQHYLLRAMQFEMFGDFDVRLTQKIKEMQTPVETAGTNPGGIDLNPATMALSTRGSGIKINLPPDINIIPDKPITGLTPIIIQMRPVYNLPLLLRIQ